MPVDSSSTTEEVESEYDDCASYDLDSSVDKARRFIVACRILIRRLPDESEQTDGSRIRERVQKLENEQDRAEKWLSRNADKRTSQGKRHNAHGWTRGLGASGSGRCER